MPAIDKAKLLEYLAAIKPDEYVSAFGEAAVQVIGLIEEFVKEMPTIEQEVRHGHWENIPGMNNTVFCSECLAAANKELSMKYKGCPFCLARMDGGADNG